MKKIKINVPNRITHISEWLGFEELLPQGRFILNKVFPGCGMTYYYLHSNKPVVLCAPRNALLRNKSEQMEEERQKNEDKRLYSLGGKEIDYYYFSPSTKKDAERRKAENDEKFRYLREFCLGEEITPYNQRTFIPKILVTYDSLPTIYPIITQSGMDFQIIMDESHVLFQDYTMKPATIERAFRILEQHPRVCYLSATPILESYMERMETFKDLPYVEFKWPDDRIINTAINYKDMKSTVEEACKIVEKYKKDGFFDTIEVGGVSYNSTEAVLFINSVRTIVEIIYKAHLRPEEVNILVANDTKNRQLISKLGEGFQLGSIPTMGATHKIFTMCSKTVFLGCDFYSTTASTYVFADANIRSMTTDISLDLPQIAGRQRLESNVFKNRCTVYVKTYRNAIQSWVEFDSDKEMKWRECKRFCKEMNNVSQDSLKGITINADEYPFAIKYQDPLTGQLMIKNSINALISMEHAWELRNLVYKDRKSVQCLVNQGNQHIENSHDIPLEVFDFNSDFLQVNDTTARMRMFCEYFDAHPEFQQYMGRMFDVSAEYINFYRCLGTERLAKHQFILSRIEPEYNAVCSRDFLATAVYSCFGNGGDFTKPNIKAVLRDIYKTLNISIAAKATDLADYYDMKEIKLSVDGHRVNGFRLTRKV